MWPGSPWLAVVFYLLVCLTPEVVHAATYGLVACPSGTKIAGHEKCCAFYDLRDDLQENLFEYRCGDLARKVLRLTFHDAIGYSGSGRLEGDGADGSIVTFSDIELSYLANIGIDEPVHSLKPFLTRHNQVSAGDLVQFAGAVGLSNCAGSPRLEFFAGRPDAAKPASDGTVPSPGDTVDAILDRLADSGFSAEELVFLLASHSIAHAGHVDASFPNATLDSTPEVFDSQFFLEVLLKGRGFPGNGSSNPFEASSALHEEGEMRLRSDFLLARDSRTACTWQSMINDQQFMMEGFQRAMARLAVTGQDKSTLVDCSDAVPLPKPLCEENLPSAAFPPGQCPGDVEQSCSAPFPVVPVAVDGVETLPLPTS